MQELNTDYLGNTTIGTDGKWYNGLNNTKTANMSSKVIYPDYRNMITSVVWNVGAISAADLKAYQVYSYERGSGHGKTACSSGATCDDDVTRTTTWTGKVGLFYFTDYVYGTAGGDTTARSECLATNAKMYAWGMTQYSDCKQNDWLFDGAQHQWFMSPYAQDGYGGYLLYVYINGFVHWNSASSSFAVRPVVYLKSNVSITGGTGSQTNPYTLG